MSPYVPRRWICWARHILAPSCRGLPIEGFGLKAAPIQVPVRVTTALHVPRAMFYGGEQGFGFQTYREITDPRMDLKKSQHILV